MPAMGIDWLPGLTNRRLRTVARRLIDAPLCVDRRLVPFGKDNVWNIFPGYLTADSLVVSGGVGQDVSTELELVAATSCRVVLFDPSPTGVDTMARAENQHPRIDYRPMGLAGGSGQRGFADPVKAAEGSFRPAVGSVESTSLPCVAVSDLLTELGASQIDLLKLDIEGFEYEVIDDLVAQRVSIGQACVEFHDFMPEYSLRQTWRALRQLASLGLRLVHKVGSDYTLLHESLL